MLAALSLGALGFVMYTLVRSIIDQRSGERSVWREFGLGLSLMMLFFMTCRSCDLAVADLHR